MVIRRVKMVLVIAHFGKISYMTCVSTSLMRSLGFGLGGLPSVFRTSADYFAPKASSIIIQQLQLTILQLYAATPFAATAVLSDVCITIALCVLLHGSHSSIIE
jgi:hypothetical protein